jgi:hypothetical protein
VRAGALVDLLELVRVAPVEVQVLLLSILPMGFISFISTFDGCTANSIEACLSVGRIFLALPCVIIIYLYAVWYVLKREMFDQAKKERRDRDPKYPGVIINSPHYLELLFSAGAYLVLKFRPRRAR